MTMATGAPTAAMAALRPEKAVPTAPATVETTATMVPIPPIMIPAMTMVAIFGGIELFMGLVYYRDSGIAHFAHLGGMLGAWLLIRHWRSGGGPRGNVRRMH